MDAVRSKYTGLDSEAYMRVTWRGLELPTRVERDTKVSSDKYGRFFVEPFERGFGTTIGNSLRRVLLSSLEGSAVTSVKIQGMDHEFTSMKGLMEDASTRMRISPRLACGFSVSVHSSTSVPPKRRKSTAFTPDLRVAAAGDKRAKVRLGGH